MKFTVTTILSVMTIGLVTLCGLKPAQAQIRVACVGDSITYGVNLASNQTYPADLQTLAGSGYNVQNFGYPGLSLMSLPGGNPSYHPAYTSTAQYTSAINFNPNIVIIMLGANDASFAPNSGQTWAQTYGSMFASQYESLVAAFKNCPAHPVVYVALCTRIAGSNQYGIDPTVLNSVIVPELSTIASVAAAPVINVFAASSPHVNDYQDNVHPTATLAQVIANTAYSSLQQYNSAPPMSLSAPTAATATAGAGAVQVAWTAPSGWVTSYNIYRSTTAGGEGTTPYASGVPGYLTNYVDASASNGTTYYYKAAAVNSVSTSAQSGEAHAVPGASLYAGLPYVTPPALPGVAFADNFDRGGQGVAYNSGSTWNYGGYDRFYDGVGLEVNTDATTNGFDVGWTAAGQWLRYTVNVATAGTYVVGFRVASGGTGGSLHLQNAAGTSLTGSVTVPGTGGWQTWSTVNASVALPAGQQALTLVEDTGNYNINFMTFAGQSAPAAPTGLAAVAGSAQVALSWNASTGAASYNIYRSTTSGGEGTTAIVTGVTGTTYTNIGLTNGTTYYYQVAAVSASGTSAQSGEVSAKPMAAAGPIANGTYTLTPQNATGSRLDATNGSNTSGTQLQIWQYAAGNANQQWIVTYQPGGYYKIQPSYNTALAVGVAGAGSANGTAVQLLTDDGSIGERWTLTAATGGYTLTPMCATGSTMNISGPSSANGTLVQIWQATGGTNTVFSFGTN